MSHAKIVLIGGTLLAAIVFVALAGWSPRFPVRGIFLSQNNLSASGTSSPAEPSQYSGITGGFVPGVGGNSLSQNANGAAPVVNGKAITSLEDVAAVIAAAPPQAPDISVGTLPLPPVNDNEIAVGDTGVNNLLDYLEYFNAHATDGIVFDKSRFGGVLKDPNGVYLLVPDLIDKALADNNFGEVQDSLLVAKDYANAEIAFLASIKVKGDAIPLDKETIGFEKLLIELVDKALAVRENTALKGEFASFYKQYLLTTLNAHQTLVHEITAVATAPTESWPKKF